MTSHPSPAARRLALIVEDETLVRLFTVDVAEEAGFAVLEASNADEALSALESRSDIDILVTDIDMPAGSMDGLALAESVNGRWPGIKIILVSGHHKATGSEIPAGSVFLSKPYRPEILTGHMNRMSA